MNHSTARLKQKGFTLVELLAAVAVLLLIMLMLGAIVNNTIRATNASKKQMDATQQARTALDVLHDDLDNLVHQGGLSTVFAKADGDTGNSTLTLITRRRGSLGMSDLRFLAITYTLDGTNLLRNIEPVSWSEVDLTLKVSGPLSSATSDVLAEGVLRFEAVVQLDNGEIKPLTAAGSWRNNVWQGTAVPNNFFALSLADAAPNAAQPKVLALTVAVATLDSTSLRMGNAAGMGAALAPVDDNGGKTPLEIWQDAIKEEKLANFPRPAISALRIMQRTYSLP